MAARIARLAVAVYAATALAGCGPREAAPAGSGKGRLFGVTYQTINNTFFNELDEGLREVVEAHGDRLVNHDANFDSTRQMNGISDFIQQEASFIFINPVNWQGIRGSLLKAKERSIPCIVVDAPARDADLAVTTVASDNLEAGRMAARALAGAKPAAKIVILHLQENKACIDRVAGFREEVAKRPGMTVLAVQEGGGKTETSRPVMVDLLGRYPELDAVFPINDPSALGAISALETAGRLGDVAVVTVDGSREGLAALAAGKLLCTIAQFPREIGRAAAEKAYEHLAGKTVEKDVKVRVEPITRESAGKFSKKG